ncbi:hypothetical protein SFUMM280S_05602 [Streptomyces fumanus]
MEAELPEYAGHYRLESCLGSGPARSRVGAAPVRHGNAPRGGGGAGQPSLLTSRTAPLSALVAMAA